MTHELVEVSTAPIDDSVFQIPPGYTKVALEDILKDQFAAAEAMDRKQRSDGLSEGNSGDG
jgi:hypothetical protein